jgi:hypothetical protein
VKKEAVVGVFGSGDLQFGTSLRTTADQKEVHFLTRFLFSLV